MRESAAVWLLGSRERIPLRTWIFLSCVCCVLCRSDSRTRVVYKEDLYRVYMCVFVCVCVCVYVCVCVFLIICVLETSKRGGLDPILTVVQQK